jgi:hypothetical protein
LGLQHPDHPDLILPLLKLAISQREQGRHSESAKSYKRVVDALEKELGPTDKTTISTLSWLAYEQLQDKQYKVSAASYQRLLLLHESVLGTEHEDTIARLSFLGQAVRNIPDWLETLKTYRRLAEYRYRTLGREHPETQLCLRWLILVKDQVDGSSSGEQESNGMDKESPLATKFSRLKILSRKKGP